MGQWTHIIAKCGSEVVQVLTHIFFNISRDLHYLTKMGLNYVHYFLNMGQLTHLLKSILFN